jgi:hypothetical protein
MLAFLFYLKGMIQSHMYEGRMKEEFIDETNITR